MTATGSSPLRRSREASAHKPGGVDYEAVDDNYMAKRQLRKGTAGPFLLVVLGVGYVIAGDYAGWNFGIGYAGWGGMMVAVALMALMYITMCLSLAELSSIIPTAGGGYGFARRALGPWGGFLTGTAVLLEYVLAPAAVVTFIGAYTDALFGVDGWAVYLLFYAVFIGLHLYGVAQVLKLILVIAGLAVAGLVIFVVTLVPHFEASNLWNIQPSGNFGASDFLPFGLIGVWAALPYAIWFFLAIEGVPLAAEEARDPARDVPKGLIGGVTVLSILAIALMVVTPGAAGAEVIGAEETADPLLTAFSAVGLDGSLVARVVGILGLVGLVSSFFTITYAYSRQTFALSRAGYLPRVLSITNGRKSPFLALLVPGAVGFVMAATGQGNLLILISVFGATVSYVLMMISHIVLRVREPALNRPYRTPGGVMTSSIALVLAAAALVAGLLVDATVILYAAAAYALMIAYFAFYSRHHLVARAPEEEFAALEAAEAELDGDR